MKFMTQCHAVYHLACDLILGGLPQKLDVVDLAITVEGVHENAEASAGCSVFVIKLGEHTIFWLCLQ